ncbi:unnamed protein product [Cuscuta campestris]|uniref:Uncharacterized protein n=1 Tax=Cuscuta campestris TaxID=132261 RepID=A0A484LWM3_9ASTE|nr:unnamed protein product [Cuscuta campestris]
MDIDLIEKLPELDAVDKIKLDGEDDEKLLEEAEQLYEHGQASVSVGINNRYGSFAAPFILSLFPLRQ